MTPSDPGGEEERERRFWRALRPRSPARPEPADGTSAHADPEAAAGAGATTPPAPPRSDPPPGTPQRPERAAMDDVDTSPPPGLPPANAAAHERADELRIEARRLALRNLLQAAEARIDRASRARRPVLASGAFVRATHGEIAGRTGIVLDADYIESRVLLDLGPDEPHRWLPFAHVGPAESGD